MYYPAGQWHAGGQGQSRDAKTSNPDAEVIHSPSGTPSQSRVGDASKPPPIAAKPRVRNAGQYWEKITGRPKASERPGRERGGAPPAVRAVFRGVTGSTPRNYNNKIFSLYKNYMLHNMWPLMLGQKPLKCQEKPSGVHKMQQTTGAAGAPPRTPLGEFTTLPRPPSWWGGG